MAQRDLLEAIDDQIGDLSLVRRSVMSGDMEPKKAATIAGVANSFSRTVREYRETDRYLKTIGMLMKK